MKIEVLEAKISAVEQEIKTVEAEIKKVEQELQAPNLKDDDKSYYRKKEEQLRKKEEQLRKKEEQLRTKEEQLRTEKQRLPAELPSSMLPPLHPNTAIPSESIEIQGRLDRILEAVEKSDRATPQYSPAHIGSQVKQQLLNIGRFHIFQEKDDEPSVLSAKEQEDLSKTQNEHQVVAFMTPYFEKVFHGKTSDTVVNSEQYKWVDVSADNSVYNEKPDLLICHHAIWGPKPPFKCEKDKHLLNMRRNSDKFGILSYWRLRDFIGATCEAKQDINHQGFGEVINYGTHICFGKHGAKRTRLILFDKQEFWLVESVKGVVANVQTCKWVDGGSQELLREFVQDPILMKVLNQACSHYNLTVDSNAFLGAGGFGYVFRVKRERDGKTLALKISPSEENPQGVTRLEQELDYTMSAHAKCPDDIVGVEEDGFTTFEGGAVLLLSDVGDPSWTLHPKRILESLKTLHANNILHGDPRLANVVAVNGQPRWIDLAQATFPCSSMERSKEDEMKRLKEEILEAYENVVL